MENTETVQNKEKVENTGTGIMIVTLVIIHPYTAKIFTRFCRNINFLSTNLNNLHKL